MSRSDIAGSIAFHAYRAAVESNMLTAANLSDVGNPLNEAQETEMWLNTILCFDGLRENLRGDLAADELMRDLGRGLLEEF